jgi:uncharacterized protein DUF222
MSPVPLPDPAPGHDGEQPPLPGAGVPDEAPRARPGGPVPPGARVDPMRCGPPPGGPAAPPDAADGGDDWDADAYLAWFLASVAGAGGAGSGFGRDEVAAALRPGAPLWALAEQAAADPAALTGDELLSVVSAARRLAARAEYLELAAVAEFARRASDQHDADAARGVRPGRRAGEFAASELAFELAATEHAAADRMAFALALAARLPRTRAGLGEGTVDGAKAAAIWYYTRFLCDADAAQADAILAAAAPGLRYDSLTRKAARLEMKLDPESARARRERARAECRRVEARRELSGNMSFGGRELSVQEALAARACNDADALGLRRAGLAGSLRELRVLAMLDRLSGRDPFARTAPAPAAPAPAPGPAPAPPLAPGPDPAVADHPADAGHPAGPGDDDTIIGCQDRGDDNDDDDADDGRPGPAAGPVVPFPALINLLVPAGTMLGWSTAPGDAGTWGLLDPDDTRSVVHTASRHPRSRWCVTVTGPDGTAVAHGCARGCHPWTPPPPATTTRARDGTTGPDAVQQAQLAGLLRALNVTFTPIAAGSCDHRHREDRYTPSRKLGHLVRARTATCPAPGCGAQAAHCDLDHTLPYPAGQTDQCNLSPPCRRHHRVKQAPGWQLEQPAPGVMRWTTPSGRVHTTTPTVYDL